MTKFLGWKNWFQQNNLNLIFDGVYIMTSHNVFSYIPVMKTDFILKTSLDKKLCKALYDVSQDKIVDDIEDNLSNVRRTNWELFADDDAAPLVEEATNHMNFCIRTRLNYPHPNQDQPGFFDNKMFYYSFATFNAWVAHYTDDSFVEPHCHTEYPGFYSCSAYISTGGKETSLSFISDEAPSFNQNKLKIPCKEGDMLIFPSHLVHYTNDTFANRSIFSANVYAGYSPNMMNHGNPLAESDPLKSKIENGEI